MEHVAYMKRSWKLLDKILSGEKTVESRWSRSRRAPFGRISVGDTIWFKDTGRPVTVKATVSSVEEHSDLQPLDVKALVDAHWRELGVDSAEEFYALVKDKTNCVLMGLSCVEKVSPFEVDKTGYGAMSAWITVEDVRSIQK